MKITDLCNFYENQFPCNFTTRRWTSRFGLGQQQIIHLYDKYELQKHLPLGNLLQTLEKWHTGDSMELVSQNWGLSFKTAKSNMRFTTNLLAQKLNEVLILFFKF